MLSSSKTLALLFSLVLLSLSSCRNINRSTSVSASTLPTKNAPLVCNSYTESGFADDYYSLSSLVNAVTTNLNNCASPAIIMDDLRFIDKQGFVFTIDLNQDHIEEIIAGGVLFLLPPAGQTWTEHDSNLVIFYQQNGKYEAKVIFEGTFNGYPEISNIMDINGDGINEAIFTIPYGGSGCNEIVSIIGWQDSEPIDYFRNVNQFVDCPAITDIVDLDHDEIMEIVQKHRGPYLNDYSPHEITFRINRRYRK